ncbi:hypothetical protein K1X12_15005 [Hyphomonas sp. WL0036]|uniref:DUF6671 family protein n=1 Tax=Hyphomonas sediminis TaxID=2866160 RepID=UPI001C7F9270|nr:DUF6671 family protein [Hyphomonas sediminis]MBY9068214.1 hypothetical protein [Hyphomonas sediminis]
MQGLASAFAGRRAVLATMHGKERAIGPAFRDILGIDIEVPGDLDTDQLGTFSGEIERPGSMDEVLVAKARLGLKVPGLDLAIASEGSFGPHPQMPFIPVGLEKIVLIDAKSGLVAIDQSVDLSPTYVSWETRCLTDIADQVRAAGFPDQAMIVRPHIFPASRAQRGLQTLENLEAAIVQAARVSSDGLAFVQTDMRAHFNPKRMMSIGSLARKFAGRLSRTCSMCAAPGWGVKRTEQGLPCSWCGAPTQWVLYEVLGCYACDNERPMPRSDGLTEADPAHCQYCNP